MKEKEKQLLISLCSIKSQNFDESLLDYASASVLGELFFNRMQAIAYGTLRKYCLLGKVNREFRNSLKAAYEQNLEKNNSYFTCLKYLSEILSECNCKYAMLKGAYLCSYYPRAYRTSNDIDLLVLPKEVTKIGNVLLKNGFKQGNISNGIFVPATRNEIIESKMLRGETVPYIKEMNLPYMKYLEVDVNFSLDYKNGDTQTLEYILGRACIKTIENTQIQTLNDSDFFIHLCSHLYKEATTLPWIEMKRDMSLYKYCDIYMLLEDMRGEGVDAIFKRAKELDMLKVVAFTILQVAAIFEVENIYAVDIARNILDFDSDFIHKVFSPKDKKVFIYTEKNILERFFAENRKELLKEC